MVKLYIFNGKEWVGGEPMWQIDISSSLFSSYEQFLLKLNWKIDQCLFVVVPEFLGDHQCTADVDVGVT